MTKVKFGLTKKEEKLFNKACVMFGKADEAQKAFYNSIQERFEKAGYDGDEVIEIITYTDSYVFSESGCTSDFDYCGCESIWDYIKAKCRKVKR